VGYTKLRDPHQERRRAVADTQRTHGLSRALQVSRQNRQADQLRSGGHCAGALTRDCVGAQERRRSETALLTDHGLEPGMRLHITGACGAGSSTLGQALATELGAAFIEADDIFW